MNQNVLYHPDKRPRQYPGNPARKILRNTLIQSVVATSLLAGSVVAEAKNYTITGNVFSFDMDTYNAYRGARVTFNFSPAKPTFTGTWSIDVGTRTIAGNANFAPYTETWSYSWNWDGWPAPPPPPTTGTATHTVDNYSVSGQPAYGYFDPIGSGGRPLFQTALDFTSTSAVYSGDPCCSAAPFATKPGLSQAFDIYIRYNDSSLDSFTATIIASTYTMQVTGVSTVPVPAAAWLFGSAVAGLAGMARIRRRRAA